MSQLAPGRIYQRHKPIRDELYLKFVRKMPCAACLKKWGIDAAHTGAHGISQKSCDYSAIPLCRTCHQDYDANPQRFAARKKLDIPALVAKLNQFYREKIKPEEAA